MRTFSFKPSLTLKGRKFKGLRGSAGKPFHPPITTIPVGAYIIAPALDIVSFLNKDQAWARDLFRASTFVIGKNRQKKVHKHVVQLMHTWQSCLYFQQLY